MHKKLTEDYVSFEIAKLLKEKVFNVECSCYYFFNNEVQFEESLTHWDWNNGYTFRYSAPTLQMAMKWLREVHNIAIETEWEHLWYAYIKPMTSKPSEEDYYQCESSKYEEACEQQ